MRARLLSLLVILGLFGCTASVREASRICLAAGEGEPLPGPPPGEYIDQDIALDYDKLAPRPNPRVDPDLDYGARVVGDPRMLEQLYFDAAHAGNQRARWLLCVFEASASAHGKTLARQVAGLSCQTLYSCDVDFEKFALSRLTASGQRVRELVGRAFAKEGKRMKIAQNADRFD